MAISFGMVGDARVRYMVFHSRTRVPIQGVDVKLQVKDAKAMVEFAASQRKRVEKLSDELDNALVGWKDLVLLLPATRLA